MHRPAKYLQRYFIQQEPQAPSLNYASAYLKLRIDPSPTNTHFQTLAECVSTANRTLSQNRDRLYNGEYDHLRLKFHLPACSTFKIDVPYEMLTHVNDDVNFTSNANADASADLSKALYDTYYADRDVTTTGLELDTWWPLEYRFIGSRIRSSDFHVSLLPLVRFEDHIESASFLRKMQRAAMEFPKTFNVTLGKKVKVLAKQDFTKFFLVVCIDETHPGNEMLRQIKDSITAIRAEAGHCGSGHVVGELDGGIIDWQSAMLHMSIGVANSPHGVPLFGSQELFFLNEVMLKDYHLEAESEFQLTGSLVMVSNGQHVVNY